jgi:hypothetical protein
MDHPDSRHRLTITGNTFQGPTAIGVSGSVIRQSQYAPASTIVDQLALVRHLLHAHPDTVTDPATADRDLHTIEDQLRRPAADRPTADRTAVRGALSRLATRIAPATVLAQAVYHLAELIRQHAE